MVSAYIIMWLTDIIYSVITRASCCLVVVEHHLQHTCTFVRCVPTMYILYGRKYWQELYLADLPDFWSLIGRLESPDLSTEDGRCMAPLLAMYVCMRVYAFQGNWLDLARAQVRKSASRPDRSRRLASVGLAQARPNKLSGAPPQQREVSPWFRVTRIQVYRKQTLAACLTYLRKLCIGINISTNSSSLY